ncbi:hypothetical protein SAMN04489759_104109 [Sulfitobacter delicatus]|uniref:Uncharacterized protein n=1 Tax=Sulfitobacter delicatus TaxID=218672 RepID=A0A1G7QM77_9RHOB|nr:hypothetical protein SAMN04489759_104109 [Sulfitobacter delicatus]
MLFWIIAIALVALLAYVRLPRLRRHSGTAQLRGMLWGKRAVRIL